LARCAREERTLTDEESAACEALTGDQSKAWQVWQQKALFCTNQKLLEYSAVFSKTERNLDRRIAFVVRAGTPAKSMLGSRIS